MSPMVGARRRARRASTRPRRSDPATADEPRLPRAEELGRLPVVALVGRPNTGKSTLFNRLTGSRRALVAATPGVTRDRNIALATCGERRFLAVDTGGFEACEKEELGKAVQAQGALAAEEADVVIVVVDGRAGLNPLDRLLIDKLRSLPKPLFVAVNKIDSAKQEHLQSDFYALGVAALYPISAEHGANVSVLMDAVLESLPAAEPVPEVGDPPTAVAIVGRPNVGKSLLLNRLVGYERSIVAALPGTTRDALDTSVRRGEQAYLIVDTAGVRRRPKVRAQVERASVVRALRALERAEIGVLVVDAVEGITDQDARIAGYAWERGRGVLLVVNKWDLVPAGRPPADVASEIEHRFPSFAVIPKLFVSALTGGGVGSIWAAIDAVAANHRLRLPTSVLNQVLRRALQQQAPPVVKGKRPRFLYATQTATAPATISIFGSARDRVAPAFERYLVNQFRAAFGIEGTPLRLCFRARERQATRGRGQRDRK